MIQIISRYSCALRFFFFNDTATTEIYTLSLHDALPISSWPRRSGGSACHGPAGGIGGSGRSTPPPPRAAAARAPRSTAARSEEHTSELQSLAYLVCRLLLEKKNTGFITSH